MSVEPGLVDANVLAYASNADDSRYAPSRALLDEARDPSVTLYVTPQILCEFYSVITNPHRGCHAVVTGGGLTGAFRAAGAARYLHPADHFPRGDSVARPLAPPSRHRPEIFDLQIIATMKANSVSRIYTFNAGDFAVFPELTVVVPGAGTF
jgi:predicted nucleic acid-binding protein